MPGASNFSFGPQGPPQPQPGPGGAPQTTENTGFQAGGAPPIAPVQHQWSSLPMPPTPDPVGGYGGPQPGPVGPPVSSPPAVFGTSGGGSPPFHQPGMSPPPAPVGPPASKPPAPVGGMNATGAAPTSFPQKQEERGRRASMGGSNWGIRNVMARRGKPHGQVGPPVSGGSGGSL